MITITSHWTAPGPGLPIGWTSALPGSVKDNLEVIYPWLRNTSQETTSPRILRIVGKHIELKLKPIHLNFDVAEEPKHKVASLFSGVMGLELGCRQSGTQIQKTAVELSLSYCFIMLPL